MASPRLQDALAGLAGSLLRTRWLVRAPVWLYRARLGLLFGHRLLMLEHTGRVTGARRYVVLEVVDRPAPDQYVVASGFGLRAQWLRNVLNDPRVRISVAGHGPTPATATLLEPAQAATVLSRYAAAHPRAWQQLKPVLEQTLDAPIDGGGTGLPLVRLSPRETPTVGVLASSLTGPPSGAGRSRPAPAGTASTYQPASPLLSADGAVLSRAFADNLFELFRAMAGLPGAELEQSGAIARHLAAPFNPMFKGAWRCRLDADQADATVAETVAWFRARQAPFFFWWVDPGTQPPDLPAALVAAGLQPWEERAPAMAAALPDLRLDLIDAVPPGYSQRPVADEADLADFGRAFVAGYQVPQWAGQAWVDATLAFGIDRAPWTCYVGRLHDRPVATNIAFNAAGVASVFGISTAPDVRGQGIGSAITLAAYQDALLAGYRYGVLFATDLGTPVYRRIGLTDVDGWMSRYLWRADQARA